MDLKRKCDLPLDFLVGRRRICLNGSLPPWLLFQCSFFVVVLCNKIVVMRDLNNVQQYSKKNNRHYWKSRQCNNEKKAYAMSNDCTKLQMVVKCCICDIFFFLFSLRMRVHYLSISWMLMNNFNGHLNIHLHTNVTLRFIVFALVERGHIIDKV